MDRHILEQKINSLLTEMSLLPEKVKDEIVSAMPSYTEEDLGAVLLMLIEWDKQIAEVYRNQSAKVEQLLQNIRTTKV